MANTKLDISISPSGTIMMLIIFAALAYFVYAHSVDAVIAVVVAIVIGAIITIVSLIPIVGWVASILVCHYWVIPKLLDVVALEYTWLITAIFVVIALYGFAITIVMMIVIIGIISAWK